MPGIALLLATVLAVSTGITGVALADNVQNNVSASAKGVVTMTSGGSATVGYSLQGVGNDGQAGCNAGDGSDATLTIHVVNATPNPSTLTFSDCTETKFVTFTSTTSGDHSVTVTVTDGGPGTYDTGGARFTLRVTPAADTTPPVLTPTITGTAGSNGWYTSEVTVSWTVSDPESSHTIGSGCAPSANPDRFTTETAGATSSCTATSAGGQSTASRTVKLDKTGPTGVVLSPSGTAGAHGWFVNDNVVVETTGSDGVSGPVTCTPTQTQEAETAGRVINGSCTNQAGLVTAAPSLTVKLDKTAPSAAIEVTSGTLNAETGWYTSDVALATTGLDSISSPVTCAPANRSLTTDTDGTLVEGACTNAAGLQRRAERLIKLDKTDPATHLVVAPGAVRGANDWFTSDVTVLTEGSDTVAEPLTCSGPQLFTANTAGTAVSGTCTNRAGRSSVAGMALKIDRTAPENVALEVSGTLGRDGWYTSNVTVRTVGTDATSGVTCTNEQLVTTETEELEVNGSCTNGAGLTTLAPSVTVRIDKSAPTANLAVTAGALGADDWYTSDVTVSTTGVDDLSGVFCTGPQVQQTETTGQTFNGSCTNGAGLATPAAPLVVKLDKTVPTASLSATGREGAPGWFVDDVTVTATAHDDISGASCPNAVRHQRDETAGEVFTARCFNGAGLHADADSLTVRLDRTRPTASLAAAGERGAGDWFIDDVTITANGDDDVSAPVTCTGTQQQTTETSGTVFNGRCTNAAGLWADAAPFTVKLDRTGPSAELAVAGNPGLDGWYVSDAVVSTTGSDPISGGVVCDGDQPFGDDTDGTIVNGSCTNGAGLRTAAAPIRLRIDKTNPTAYLEVAPGAVAGADDWYTSDVTVQTFGADNVSDPTTCTRPQVFETETAGVTVNGSCTNSAGRSQGARPIVLMIDKTPPTDVRLEVAEGVLGANGWYTSAVTVRTVGTETISGLECSAVQTFSSETPGVTVNGSCTNGAGMTVHAAPLGIKIDRTAPSAVLAVTAGTAGENGWYTSDVTVGIAGDDSLSGVTCAGGGTQTTDTTGRTFTGLCTNGAGLRTNAEDLVVKLDKSAPSASLNASGTLGSNGWYVGDVLVAASGVDGISGPVTCTPATQQQLSDTTAAGARFNSRCTNGAGLHADAQPMTVKVDQSAAAVAVTGVDAGATYTLGSVPAAGCSTVDPTPGSGVASIATVSVTGGSGTSNKVGTFTAACDGARDLAGNATPKVSVTYRVVFGQNSGILQPINIDNSSVFSRGRSVPVKLAILGDEQMGSGFATSAWTLQRISVSCTAFAVETGTPEDVPSNTPSTSFRYDAAADHYIYNADFRSQAIGSCWKVVATLEDGTRITSGVFKLQK